MSNCAINSRFNLGMVGGIPADQLVKSTVESKPQVEETPVETPIVDPSKELLGE